MDWIKYFIINPTEAGVKINMLKQGILYKINNIIEYLDNKPNGYYFNGEGIYNYLYYYERHICKIKYVLFKNNMIRSIERIEIENNLYYDIMFYDDTYELESLRCYEIVKPTPDEPYGYASDIHTQYEWYKNGNIKTIDHYQNNKPAGCGYKWRENGKLIRMQFVFI